MAKKKKLCDIGEPLQNVIQNHFHKIGKFEKFSPRENQNI